MPARQNTSPSHRSRSATATAANTLMASRSIRQAASVPPVAFVSFIGSARVGWSLHHKLAPGTRSALEHGGVAPAIVDRSADLGRIIEPMVKGGYYHAGQVCVPGDATILRSLPGVGPVTLATLLTEAAG